MSVKDTKAEVNTITYDKDKIEDKVGSIYEAIVIMGKRAEQINAEIRTELHNKLDEFAVHNSTLEEVLKTENRLRSLNITKNFQSQLLLQLKNG
jgi:DNA-directed RNA polymerase subunit K/omega